MRDSLMAESRVRLSEWNHLHGAAGEGHSGQERHNLSDRALRFVIGSYSANRHHLTQYAGRVIARKSAEEVSPVRTVTLLAWLRKSSSKSVASHGQLFPVSASA
jgi:hypothetical protein